MAKDARITVRLDQRTLDKAKAVARKARRTVCDWTRITIEEAVRINPVATKKEPS